MAHPSVTSIARFSVACALVCAVGVVACIDDDDGRQACEALASKCLPVGRTAKCDAKAINADPNGSAIEDCMQAAADCDTATACMSTLQR